MSQNVPANAFICNIMYSVFAVQCTCGSCDSNNRRTVVVADNDKKPTTSGRQARDAAPDGRRGVLRLSLYKRKKMSQV